MRFAVASAALLSLASAGSSQVLPAQAAGPAPKYPIGASKAPFAKAVGRLFEIDGKVQYFAGTNSWWLAHLSKNEDVDLVLKQMVDAQYKITRVWGFGDVNAAPPSNSTDPNKVWFQLLNSTGSFINYGADGLERLDYVVSAAERAGVGLVIPFVNNWDDYGGIRAYVQAFGGNATSWFTDARSQEAYRAYIRAVVGRYKSSPAVFAWELGNEPRCQGGSYATIVRWTAETSRYIKGLDPGHMVTTGEEGFFDVSDGLGDGLKKYGGVDGTSFTHNLAVDSIDYGTFHLYPNWWSYPYSWGNAWIQVHDEVGKKIGKPVILEEYGSPFPHNHTETVKSWLDTVLASGLAADQIWQFGPNGTSVSPPLFGDEFTVYVADDEFAVLGREHAAAMLNKPVLKSQRRKRSRWF